MMRPTNDDATKFPKNSVDLMFARTLNVNSFLADCMVRAWYMFTVQRGGGAGEIDAGGPEPRQRKRKFTGLFQVS